MAILSRPYARRTILVICMALSLILMHTGARTVDAAKSPSESELKAAFLFNFAKFVEWPAGAFANESSPIVIGLLSDDSFVEIVSRTVKGKTVNGRKFSCRSIGRDSELDGCHILFIGETQRRQIDKTLEKVKGSSVLVVGETDGFVKKGIIGFVTEESKVRFEINVANAKKNRLKISSQLLKLAKRVID